MESTQPIYRHFSFTSFNHLFPHNFIKQTWLNMKPYRRKRYLGLDGFLWLGLFTAAHTYLPNLQSLLHKPPNFLNSLISNVYYSREYD